MIYREEEEEEEEEEEKKEDDEEEAEEAEAQEAGEEAEKAGDKVDGDFIEVARVSDDLCEDADIAFDKLCSKCAAIKSSTLLHLVTRTPSAPFSPSTHSKPGLPFRLYASARC